MDHVVDALVTILQQDSAFCLARADVVDDDAVCAHYVVVDKRVGECRFFLQVVYSLGCEFEALHFHCGMM